MADLAEADSAEADSAEADLAEAGLAEAAAAMRSAAGRSVARISAVAGRPNAAFVFLQHPAGIVRTCAPLVRAARSAVAAREAAAAAHWLGQQARAACRAAPAARRRRVSAARVAARPSTAYARRPATQMVIAKIPRSRAAISTRRGPAAPVFVVTARSPAAGAANSVHGVPAGWQQEAPVEHRHDQSVPSLESIETVRQLLGPPSTAAQLSLNEFGAYPGCRPSSVDGKLAQPRPAGHPEGYG